MLAGRTALAFVALALLAPSWVFAAEAVRSIDTFLTIRQDSSVEVLEIVSYDFADTPDRHGIFRDIPLSFTTPEGRLKSISISDISVSVSVNQQDGVPVPFEVSIAAGVEHIRIGNPNATVSGVQTYSIDYFVHGALTPYDSFDELYWNATGDTWALPIGSSSATVDIPTLVATTSLRLACYVGVKGSRTSCDISANPYIGVTRTSFFYNNPLAPGEGLTVAVGFPKGLVSYPPPVPWWRQWQFSLLALVLLLCAIGYAVYRVRSERAQGRGTIIPIYEPPQGLRPAEGQVIVKGKIDTHAWPATIVDLAVRGFVKIQEEDRRWWQLAHLYLLMRNTNTASTGLKPYEQKFLDALFTESNTFSTGDLQKDPARSRALYTEMTKLEGDLYESTESDTQAYDYDPAHAKKWRTGFRFVGIAVAILFGLVIGGIDIPWSPPADAILAFLLGLGALYILIQSRFLRPHLNPLGAKDREDWLGFKLYLETAEKYRLQNLTPDIFQKFLPYAMVFGIEKKWAKAFEGIAMPPPDWYSGSAVNAAAFSASGFTNNFSSSFSSSFASSGAGGASGGGGGAGGGGGGGGGGGW